MFTNHCVGVECLAHFKAIVESYGGKSWPLWCQQCRWIAIFWLQFDAKLRRVDLHFIFNASCIYILHSSDSVHFFNQFSICDVWCLWFFCFFFNMVKWVSLKPITWFLKLIFHVLDLETEGFEHFVSRHGFRRIWLLVFVYRSCVFWILKPSHNFDF